MTRDSQVVIDQGSSARTSEIAGHFNEALREVEQGETKQRTIFVVSIDHLRRATAHSSFAPIGTASPAELEQAFHSFVKELTGEEHAQLLDMAMKEPDTKKRESHWDKLTTTFGTMHGDILLGVNVIADDHGIWNAEWYLAKPQQKPAQRLGHFFKQAATLFVRH